MRNRVSLTLIINLFFIFFLSVSVGIIYKITSNSIRERTDIENLRELEILHSYLTNYISRLESTVVQLSEVESIKKCLRTRDSADMTATSNLFSSILEYSTKPLLPTIDHIRLIDLEGNEILRVNSGAIEGSYVVPTESLQNKSDRYYFKDMAETNKGECYLSPVDLNIEYGKLEQPLKSVFRVGKRIYLDNKPLGYILINANFTPLSNQLENVKSQKNMDWFITNKDGFYIINRDKSKEFSFMFPGEEQKRLSNDFPDIWNSMQKRFSSISEYKRGIIYLKKLDFGNSSNRNSWIIGSNLSKSELSKKNNLLNRGIVFGYLFLTPLLTITGIFLGKSISQNRFYIEELKNSSTHDKLTGLLNYQGALEKADILTKLSNRMEKNLYSVFIDLNDLKKINDNYGHKAGDNLIISMSSIISREVRDTDAAGRLGGDEFILLLFDLDNKDIKVIMNRIESDFAKEGKKIFGWKTRFSWGHSQWYGQKDDIESFISRADSNMYEMKRKFKR